MNLPRKSLVCLLACLILVNPLPCWSGETGQITFTIEVTNEESKPDLVIDSLRVMPNPVNGGGTVTISFTVKNQGTAPSDDSLAGLYLGGRFKGEFPIDALEAGETSPEQVYECANVPGVPLFSEVLAVADESDEVDESNENNNEKSLTLEVNVPDLVVTSLKTVQIAGTSDVRLTYRVKNQGKAPTGKRVYILNELCQQSNGKGKIVRKWTSVGSLQPGQTSPLQRVILRMPASKGTGSYWGRVTVDASPANGGAVVESDETNNSSKDGFRYTKPVK